MYPFIISPSSLLFQSIFAVRLCKVLLLVVPSFGMYCMELPTQHGYGDVELVTYASSIKGPPPPLKQRAAAAVVRDIARLSKTDQQAAQKKLEKTLSVLPSECWECIEEALWYVHDPCIVKNVYKQPSSGAYDCDVGYIWTESSLIDYDTGVCDTISDLIVTRIGTEDQRHIIDLARTGVFSDDGRYVVLMTHPWAADTPHTSVYDRETRSWRSLAFSAASYAFIDDHRMVCCSLNSFSLIDCAATDLSVQTIISLSGQQRGRWSPFGEGIVRLVGESILVHSPQPDGWLSSSYTAPCPIARCITAGRRGVLACLHAKSDEGYISFVKIADGSCDVVSRIGVVSGYGASNPTGFSFFGKEQLCALGLPGRFCTLIISCADLLNPQIIQKIDMFSNVGSVIGQKIYSKGAIIMPNILLSYYAAYKKKSEQQRDSSCTLS